MNLADSTEPLSALLDALPASVARVQRDFTLSYANARLAQALGRPLNQILGKTCAELGMESDTWGDWVSHINRVFSTGESDDLTFLTEHQGRPRLVRATFAPLKAADGSVDSVLVHAQIVDQLDVLARHVSDINQRFHAFMDHMPLVAWLRDEQERYVYLNPSYQRIMKADPKEWYGKHVREMWPEATAEQFLANDAKLLASGQPIEVEESGMTPTGEFRHWLNVKFTYYDSGHRLFYGGVGLDITNFKEAEQRRLAFEKQMLQTQKFESLGVLAGGVAHDFNNILTSILGFATLAKLQNPQAKDSQLFENLTQIENSALRAAELCQQMLAYAGRGMMVMRPENLNSIIEKMASLLATVVRKSVVFKTYLSPQVLPVECDASQVRQVVLNLVTNSSDAIGERSGVITITTGVIDADEKYLSELNVGEPLKAGRYSYIEVSDNGCGMTDEVKARIFEPFFTTKFVGRGLGLSAVQGIMRGHGGCLKVYSQLNKGTTVKVLFPALTASDSLPEPYRPENTPQQHAGGRHILVVDDEEDVRVLTRKYLESIGYQVTTANNGREAVELFRTAPQEFHLVIMDLTMPRMNGQDAFRELRQIRADVKVILTSGYNENEATSGFEGKGLAGFLCKPFRFHDLFNMIQKQLGSNPLD